MFDTNENDKLGNAEETGLPAPDGNPASPETQPPPAAPDYEYTAEPAEQPAAEESVPPYYPAGAPEERTAETTPPPPGYMPPPYSGSGQQPPAYPQQPYGAQPGGNAPPPQQTQWTFNDYGPIGGTPKPKKQKQPKPEKSDRVPGNSTGVKVLAIVMSALFVLSVAGFGGYILYDNSREPARSDSGAVSSEPYHIQDPPALGGAPESTPTYPVITGSQMTPAELYKAVEPAVVGVVGYLRSTTTGVYMPTSQGSGVVFDSNGYIVTNRHVIKNSQTEQNWDKIEVIRTTGETYTAEVLGSDKETDLAVLKIEETDLTAAVLGDSDKLEVGDQAFVIGNPSGLEYAGSLAGGYISAVNREVLMESTDSKVELIQTDAAINPGNSGGALVDIYGQVIGITSAKLVGEEYEGMGFAIPINSVKPIVESLVDNGYVAGRVQIGLTYQVIDKPLADLNGIPQGLRVVTVSQESDAYAKGLQSGDIIYRMDGAEVHDTPDVKQALLNKNPGDQILLSVYRVGSDDRAERLEISVTLMEKAAEE